MTAKLTIVPYAVAANREQNMPSGTYIAIVDDEESVCRAFARLLRAYSFAPEIYLSGDEFLESLGNRVPACVIVDVHLSGMNGFEVLHRVSGMGINIPVIVVTARDEPAVRRDFALCAATALLTKPVSADSLLNAIESALCTFGRRGAEGWGP